MMKSKIEKYTLEKMFNDYTQGDLKVNLEYQRGAKWKLPQQVGLIDSLLRDYEIPIFYIHKKTETNKYIVDGQQRLNAIANFIQNNKFILSPSILETHLFTTGGESSTWVGKTFESLSEEDRTRFLNRELRVVEIEAEDNDVRALFIRLQAGTALTDQEKRDAWPGDVTEFVIKLAGKKGHPLSTPHPFFDILKNPQTRKKNNSDEFESEYLSNLIEDDRVLIRRFFALLTMTITTRLEQGRDFVGLKTDTVNQFYLKHLQFLEKNKEIADHIIDLLDKLVALKYFETLKKIPFTWVYHFALLVDSLLQGNYVDDWQNKIVRVFLDLQRNFSNALQDRKKNPNQLFSPSLEALLAAFSKHSGSNNGDIIKNRHAAFIYEMYLRLNLKTKTPQILDKVEREIIWLQDHGTCRYHSDSLPEHKISSIKEAEFYQITKHTTGGKMALANIVLLCQQCYQNCEKMDDMGKNGMEAYFQKQVEKTLRRIPNKTTSESMTMNAPPTKQPPTKSMPPKQGNSPVARQAGNPPIKKSPPNQQPPVVKEVKEKPIPKPKSTDIFRELWDSNPEGWVARSVWIATTEERLQAWNDYATDNPLIDQKLIKPFPIPSAYDHYVGHLTRAWEYGVITTVDNLPPEEGGIVTHNDPPNKWGCDQTITDENGEKWYHVNNLEQGYGFVNRNHNFAMRDKWTFRTNKPDWAE
jgi:hypothetical protein